MKLGKLKKVPLREIWKHEALDFTNWLADEANLELLSDSIGVTITNSQTEVGVGKFSVDILAEDENGKKIIIENQLEKTNHDHLGKIITYASGLDAEVIIWVVEKARQEHEQAVNWLNENTNENANFFLIEVEAWKIGDSEAAPKLNIVAKPNDWAKVVRSSSPGSKITDTKLNQQEFWTKLKEYGEENSKVISSWQNPRPQHWFNISIGSSKANLVAQINSVKNEVSMNLWIKDDKQLYSKLLENQSKIEASIGSKLEWKGEGRKSSLVSAIREGDFQNEDTEQELISWLLEEAEAFAKVFRKYL